MHNQYQGRFEKEYWVRRIYTLIQNINDISGSNINLENEKLHDDEIGDLVKTFDHMAKEIDKEDWTKFLDEEIVRLKRNI